MNPSDLLSPDAAIPDRRAFAKFLSALATDLRTNPESWERTDLATYLEVVAVFAATDYEQVHRNLRGSPPPEPPTWRTVADLFAAGRGAYEDWDVEP